MKIDLWTTIAALAAAAVLGLAVAPEARAQADAATAMDDQWHFALVPYVWFTGIDGTISVKGLPPVAVEASFSEIFENFDFGLQGRFEARKNRFGLGLDFMYVNLGAEVPSLVFDVLEVGADVRQLIAEGFLSYRLAHGGRQDNPGHLDLFAGVRYYDTHAQLKATGPEGGEVLEGTGQSLKWADATFGLRFRTGLGARGVLIGRGDLATLGSDLTWNLEGDLGFKLSHRWMLGAGWRHLAIDYEQGEGFDRKLVDLAYDGPRVWFAYTW